MEHFYLTFGVKYPEETHPVWSGANGNGWVRIVADNMDAARELAVARLGIYWAFIYDEAHFNPSEKMGYYPLGELMTIEQAV